MKNIFITILTFAFTLTSISPAIAGDFEDLVKYRKELEKIAKEKAAVKKNFSSLARSQVYAERGYVQRTYGNVLSEHDDQVYRKLVDVQEVKANPTKAANLQVQMDALQRRYIDIEDSEKIYTTLTESKHRRRKTEGKKSLEKVVELHRKLTKKSTLGVIGGMAVIAAGVTAVAVTQDPSIKSEKYVLPKAKLEKGVSLEARDESETSMIATGN